MFALSIGAYSIVSCEKEVVQNASIESLTKDVLLKSFGKGFAKTLKDKEVVDFFRKEASKKIDGDYDVLFASNKNILFNEKPLLSSIISNIEPIGNIKKSSMNDILESFILDSIPTLNISIPNIPANHDVDWDGVDPWFVVVTSDLISIDFETINVFDIDGNEFNISSKTPPDHPVIVIGPSERIIAIPISDVNKKTLMEPCTDPLYEDDNYQYYELIDLNNCSYSDTGGSNGTGTSSSCDRDNNANRDLLSKIKFKSMSSLDAAEGWWHSDFEMQAIFVYAYNGEIAEFSKFFVIEREHLRSGGWLGINPDPIWCSLNTRTFLWEKDMYSEVVKVKWIENDGGGSTTISTSLTYEVTPNLTQTNSISTTITKDNTHLGDDILNYCAKTSGDGTTYDTGMMYFRIEQ